MSLVMMAVVSANPSSAWSSYFYSTALNHHPPYEVAANPFFYHEPQFIQQVIGYLIVIIRIML